MSSRAEELASQFERVNEDVIATISAVDDSNLAVICPAEQCTAAALATHIGGAHAGIVNSLIKPVVNGQEPPPFTLSAQAERNAQAAIENEAMPREQIITLLRQNGAMAAAYVRSLDDEDLARTTKLPLTGDSAVTVEQVIEWVLIGHAKDHLNSLRQGLG